MKGGRGWSLSCRGPVAGVRGGEDGWNNAIVKIKGGRTWGNGSLEASRTWGMEVLRNVSAVC